MTATVTRSEGLDRVSELLAVWSALQASVAELLCDRRPAGEVAYTVVEPDLSALDLTYGELRQASERFAAGLVELGVVPATGSPRCMGKSAELPVTLLGIWRLGAVHVPLFTAFAPPGDRVAARWQRRRGRCRRRLAAAEAGPRLGSPHLRVHGRRRRGPGVRLSPTFRPARPGLQAVRWRRPTVMVHVHLRHHRAPEGRAGAGRPIASFAAYLEFGLDVRPDDVFWNAADPGWAYGLYYGISARCAGGPQHPAARGLLARATWRCSHGSASPTSPAAPTVYRALRAADLRRRRLRLQRASSAGEPLTPR